MATAHETDDDIGQYVLGGVMTGTWTGLRLAFLAAACFGAFLLPPGITMRALGVRVSHAEYLGWVYGTVVHVLAIVLCTVGVLLYETDGATPAAVFASLLAVIAWSVYCTAGELFAGKLLLVRSAIAQAAPVTPATVPETAAAPRRSQRPRKPRSLGD